MRLFCRFAAGILVLTVCAPLCAQQSAPPAVFGWRGDGTGKYPNANPPLDWGRVAKSVKELSAQSRKPKDGEVPAKENAIPDGILRKWLLLGPMPITPEKNIDDLLPNADALTPAENDSAGELKWKAVSLETDCMDLCDLCQVPVDKRNFAAFAVTWLYSPSGSPLGCDMLCQGQGTLRVWLNGKVLYTNGKNLDLDPGARLTLPVQKGWNRLMVMNAKTLNNRKTWWFRTSLYGDKDAQYESHGIVWSTLTYPTGSSSPVIAGDRLFVTNEGSNVMCINKADGKILWSRTVTYFDFATDEERKANPQIFAEIEPWAAKLKKIDQTDTVVPWIPPGNFPDTRFNHEDVIEKGMRKVSKGKYCLGGQYGCEYGNTVPNPVTDGQFVYALFNNGIAACFDLEGNRKWIRLVNHQTVEHGYTTSPLLVDGKLIIYLGSFLVLNAKTGDVILERPHYLPPGKEYNWYTHFHGTGISLQCGNEKVLYFLNGEFVRLSDGKTLTLDMKKLNVLGPAGFTEGVANRIAVPVVENDIIYKITRGDNIAAFKLPPLQGDSIDPQIVRQMQFSVAKFPYFYEPFYDATPLIHEGLIYCLNDFGILSVLDVATGDLLYQQQIDAPIHMPYNSAGRLKGGASASPTLAGKFIYCFGNQGTCVIIQPGRTFKLVARLSIDNFLPGWQARQEVTTAEPIFEGERMYYRAESTLYCIGPK